MLYTVTFTQVYNDNADELAPMLSTSQLHVSAQQQHVMLVHTS